MKKHQVTDHGYDIEEPCPWCGCMVPVRISPADPSLEVICPECGRKMMLCTMCHDIFDGWCDWDPVHGCSKERKE